MSTLPTDSKGLKLINYVVTTLHIVVILAAILLLLIITLDIFDNVSFWGQPQYMKLQLWICVLFMSEIVFDFFFDSPTLRHRVLDIIFFLLCLPFVNIIDYFGLHVTGELYFILRFLPFLRAIYVLVEGTSTMRTGFVTNLSKAYIILFSIIVYVSSLMFYIAEHPVNNDVDSYWSALWWTIMTLTTAGCYITEITTVGKVLSVVLSGGGLILFPVFTVYVANIVGGQNDTKTDSTSNISVADKNPIKNNR